MPGTFIVSLDFELYWGMLEFSDYQDHVLGGRKAIPQLLALFEKYGIHATWATVGFMFAENYQELSAFFPPEDLRPAYEDPALNTYAQFSKIGEDEESAPCFYAPSLIRRISETPGQEIGSHTFSHFYSREKGQTTEQFAADMKAAKAIAAAHGYEITSVVMPRNQCEPEYTEVLRQLGFLAYRDEEDNWIHDKIKCRPLLRALRQADIYFPLTGHGCYAPKNENGIWNLTTSKMYKSIWRPFWFLEGVKLWRIKGQMRYAAKHGLTYHLWWHPHNIGVMTEEHLAQLEALFCYYEKLKEKYGMESLNMREAAQRASEE